MYSRTVIGGVHEFNHNKLMPRRKMKKVVVVRQVASKRNPSTNPKRKSKKRRPGKSRKSASRSASTPAGLAFQRCTLAPFDFTDTGFSGIPDEYDGKVITKKHTSISSLPSYTTGHDLYIVQLPTPGVAYWYGDRVAGSTGAITLTAVNYSDSTSFFPADAEDTNVEAFRYASNTLEFVPTVNAMTWGGAIEVWKSKVDLGITSTGATGTTAFAEVPLVTGLMETLAGLRPQSVFALKDGAYAPSRNVSPVYEWRDVRVSLSCAELTANAAYVSASPDTGLTMSGRNIVGFGTFEATIMKFPAIIASQTGLLRCEACVEYQVALNSPYYEFAHDSPAHDPMALAVVKAYHKAMPCAVPFKENASFWEHFCKWAGIGAEIASYIPGPIGMIAKGVNGLFRSTTFANSGYAK